jgi:hypothetical protein
MDPVPPPADDPRVKALAKRAFTDAQDNGMGERKENEEKSLKYGDVFLDRS